LNDVLKQRLVGALVIVVLTVIFWPMIFVGPEGEPLDRNTQVPRIPSLKQMQLDAPEPLQGIAPVALASSTETGESQAVDSKRSVEAASVIPKENAKPVAESAATVEKDALPDASTNVKNANSSQEKPQPDPAPRLDKQGIPIAWALQVVSVGKQEKAETLVQELLDMGYKGYFKAVSHDDGTLYRVYLGPKFERGKVQEAKLVIDKKFRVNSIVTRYLP
jgi:DedD protein